MKWFSLFARDPQARPPELAPRGKLNATFSGTATFLVLDIVGLDAIYPKYEPSTLFTHIDSLENQIIGLASHYGARATGGLVSGLILVFGWDDKPPKEKTHAKDAIECADRIQRINRELLDQHARYELPILILRAGIHTDYAALADYRGSLRGQHEILSRGLRITQSLAHACNLGAVMCSATTLNTFRAKQVPVQFSRERRVRVPGEVELMPAFEHDPLTAAERTTLVELLRKVDERQRTHQRISFRADSGLVGMTDRGQGELVNFSRGGLAIFLPADLATGTPVSLRFEGGGAEMGKDFAKFDLTIINCEVRWSKPVKSRVLHGLQYVDLSDVQKEKLLSLFKPYASDAKA